MLGKAVQKPPENSKKANRTPALRRMSEEDSSSADNVLEKSVPNAKKVRNTARTPVPRSAKSTEEIGKKAPITRHMSEEDIDL